MSSANHPSPKAAHYQSALTAALLKGAWADAHPGAAPNGTQLSWGELVRKWSKHTGGNTELVHRIRDISLVYLSTSTSTSSSGFINVPPPSQASIPATITSTPSATTGQTATATNASPGAPAAAGGSTNSSADETNTSHSASSFIHVPHPHLRRHRSRLSTDTPTGGPTGARHHSPAAGSRATYLNASDLDGDDAPDGSSWSTGSSWARRAGADEVDEVREGIKALQSILSQGQASSPVHLSAQVALGYHLHALGDHEEALRVLGSVEGYNPQAGVVDGDAAVMERIRTKTLQGLSAELQSRQDDRAALQHYTSIIPLLSLFTSISPLVPSYISGQTSKLPFDTHRELHRWLSTALWRAAVLSARQADSNRKTIQVLRTYHAYSSSWPSTFRPLQRQRMIQLYLRALYAEYPPPNTSPASPYTLDTSIQTPSTSARALWRKETIDALRLGRSLMSATTSFPRAGSINTPVRRFISLAVALADRCAALQTEAIGVLWWAMTLTFQSQSILRHLTRLQVAHGEAVDARRTFELYVQLVLKARETQQPETSLQLKRRDTEDHPAGPRQIAREAADAMDETGGGNIMAGRKGEMAETEIDDDEDFVEALLVGARLLLKGLNEPEEAWRYVNLAGDVVEAADTAQRRVARRLRAEVEEVKGIVRMAMAARGVDPVSRPEYQAQAINHLKASTELNDNSPIAFYQLAFCQAEARSIDAALSSIRRSLELDSRNVQSWHLLALILSAQNDWDGAAKAGEAGVNVWEQDEDRELSEEEAAGSGDPTVASRDFGSSAVEQPHARTLATEPLLLPTGDFHPPHIDSGPPRSALTRAERLENVIRLRMTLNIIAEKTLGAETAMLRQQELFAFFSGRSGRNRAAGGGGYSKGMTGSTSVSSVGPNQDNKDLGGSYISVDVPVVSVPDEQQSSVIASVQPPTPVDDGPAGPAGQPTSTTTSAAPVALGTPIPGHSVQSSPAGSVATSENDSPDDRDAVGGDPARKEKRKSGATKRLVAKHLHVPHGGSGRSSRPSSVRRLPLPEDKTVLVPVQRSRNASTSSTALSIAPTTGALSHFRASTSHPTPPPPPPPAQTRPPSEHNAAELRILSNLWLMSAATFRRWRKPEQCLVAIEEAEVLDPENPDVWVQLGLYHLATLPKNYEAALPSFTKALLLRPDHPPSLVGLSKVYLETGQVELAHSLLNQMTQGAGWDVSEAWFYLGKVCERQERTERARECWRYALELEESRPARRWEDAVDRS